MLILFDCDGTLVDSHQQIISSMQYAFSDTGLDIPRTKEVANIIGLSLQAAIQQLGCHQAKQIAAIITRYRYHYNQGSSTLFSDTKIVLANCRQRGFDMGVVTGKSMSGLMAVLEQHDLRDYFLVMRTADCCPSKPHPAMVQQSMVEMGAQTKDTCVVGDATFDIQMAVAAGVQGIGVSTGSHTELELRGAGASLVVQNLNGLLNIFEGLTQHA